LALAGRSEGTMNETTGDTERAPEGDAGPRCKCGRPRHATRRSVCTAGHNWKGGDLGAASRFPPGEPGPNLRHGLRSEVHRAKRLAERRSDVETRKAEIVKALGGSVDGLQMLIVERLAVASVLVADFDDELLGGGCQTETKRSRRAVRPHETYSDRIARLAGLLRTGQAADPLPLGERLARAFAPDQEDRSE
jgi:hypothetical protein